MSFNSKTPVISVLGGDDRSRMLAAALAAKGYNTVDVPFLTPDEQLPQEYGIVILPLPVTRDGTHLNCAAEGVRLVDIISKFARNTLVLGGCVSERLSDMLDQAGAKWVDYYQREDVLQKNAYLTAEGTLSLIMQNMPRTVKGARIMVIGCGRCGRSLARLLKRIGARVTLTSRKKRHRLATLLAGVKAAKTADISAIIGRFDVVVNTAPSPVLDSLTLKRVNPLALVIELATGAVGVDVNAAKALGIKAIYTPGLPGKCVPESAALVLRDAVIKIISEEFT